MLTQPPVVLCVVHSVPLPVKGPGRRFAVGFLCSPSSASELRTTGRKHPPSSIRPAADTSGNRAVGISVNDTRTYHRHLSTPQTTQRDSFKEALIKSALA